ncbi:MAG: diphthine synthase [Candidatus Aenigmatarchaeota archaeon]
MLTFIGLGLFDEKDISLRSIEEAKKADKIYIELYTSKWFGSLENLEKIVGKKIIVAKRSDLEENSEKILEEAKKSKIIIFVLGDPLVATTHSSLILEARKRGIKTKIIHNASIISAIGETGLHLQKFGPYVTIPFPERTKGKLPESIYDVIKMNKIRGLHTLCLLDINENKVMNPKEAIKILLDLENLKKENLITKDSKIIVLSKAGSDDSKIVFNTIKNLQRMEINTPAVLIIPGKLHFTEEEFLSSFKI